MKNQRRYGWVAIAVLGVIAVGATGCYRAQVIPTAKPDLAQPLSKPKTWVNEDVPLEKDPTNIYRIGPRDVLRVDVRKDPSISAEYIVNAEGQILIPNIGPVRVMELTAQETEDMLNEVLAQFILQPDVSVGISQYNSKVIYVVGQVNAPGPQVMRADMLKLNEAIYGAGLHTTAAALKRAKVISPDLTNPVVRQIDLTDIIYKGVMSENILLKPDDIVYIPAKYSTNVSGAIRDMLLPVETVARVGYQAAFLSDMVEGDTDRGRSFR